MAIATGTAILGGALLGGAASIAGGMMGADAAESAAETQAGATRYAADIGQKQFEQTREDQLPWMEAGERALGTLEGMMADRPTMEDFEMSDYSQFMRDEGLRGIEAKSRAGGYYNTGATSREMLDYSQNVAGRDYDNYLNQYYQSLNPYMSMAGMGQQQVNTMGQMGAQQATQQGNLAMAGANAEAQGIIGKSNAYTGAMENLTGLGMMGLSYAGQGGGGGYQVPQGWGSQSTGGGFQSAWEV